MRAISLGAHTWAALAGPSSYPGSPPRAATDSKNNEFETIFNFQKGILRSLAGF